jgi:hypothetical protein
VSPEPASGGLGIAPGAGGWAGPPATAAESAASPTASAAATATAAAASARSWPMVLTGRHLLAGGLGHEALATLDALFDVGGGDLDAAELGDVFTGAELADGVEGGLTTLSLLLEP